MKRSKGKNPPAPKVLGRDLPDGTRKRLQVYLGGGVVPLTVGVDFAAPLLVHVGRVEWVEVSRYM